MRRPAIRSVVAALEVAAQARLARDPATRRALASIANDELRHAQLSWDIDAWARSRLTALERAELDAARGAAAVDLRARIRSAERAADRATGRPATEDRLALVDALASQLWAA